MPFTIASIFNLNVVITEHVPEPLILIRGVTNFVSGSILLIIVGQLLSWISTSFKVAHVAIVVRLDITRGYVLIAIERVIAVNLVFTIKFGSCGHQRANSRFLLSTQAVAIVVPQLIWCLDFAYQATTGDQILGAARYMFNPQTSVFVRVLSLFPVWMPAMLLWLVWKNGYDRSAWKLQIVILWCVLLTIFCCLDAPQSASQNINKVFGWGDTAQTLMPPILWLSILMTVFPLGIYLPSHLVFKHVFQAECATAKPCLAETAA